MPPIWQSLLNSPLITESFAIGKKSLELSATAFEQIAFFKIAFSFVAFKSQNSVK